MLNTGLAPGGFIAKLKRHYYHEGRHSSESQSKKSSVQNEVEKIEMLTKTIPPKNERILELELELRMIDWCGVF